MNTNQKTHKTIFFRKRKPCKFTLIELLVRIAITAIVTRSSIRVNLLRFLIYEPP